MDTVTVERLTRLAPQIKKFMDLHPDEQEWMILIVGRAEKRAIAVLEAIQGAYLTYQQIAEEVDCHPTTVKQILYALDAGGIPLKTDKTGRWSTPVGGRNRRLIKIGEVENEGNNI
jgi:hypothetical protein